MSDFDRNIATARAGYRPEVAIDAGLRAYMIRVYNYMMAGLALTGLVAWLTFSQAVVQTGAGLQLTPFGQTIFQGPLMWVFVLAPLGLVLLLSFGINRAVGGTALALFFVYSGAPRLVAVLDLPGLHPPVDHAGFLHHGSDVRRHEPVWLHDAA